MNDKLSPELLTYIEEIGLHHESQGISRIAGLILGLLMVTEGALSAEQIASSLKVSLGSVSTNIRLLLQTGHVEKKGVTGDRVTYYIFSPNAMEKEVLSALKRAASLQTILEKGAQIESVKENELLSKRFASMKESAVHFEGYLEKLLAHWRSQS
ncbi:MarR family transcriptional regulator [Brevibacillus nitrificans]|uniref:GbsR/MarR family transcriptional regulator n=1 Tax=Brevibacillus nitrificans TaxID=651560 RepID=UPI0028649D83|nr:MarR family transcriptional regulator [Brevibacillus nitrificans]MDR7314582.1 DNA-binding transcriptional regulator GbsR (MarR family) [Brevibacillus nitrificans]